MQYCSSLHMWVSRTTCHHAVCVVCALWHVRQTHALVRFFGQDSGYIGVQFRAQRTYFRCGHQASYCIIFIRWITNKVSRTTYWQASFGLLLFLFIIGRGNADVRGQCTHFSLHKWECFVCLVQCWRMSQHAFILAMAKYKFYTFDHVPNCNQINIDSSDAHPHESE